MQAKEFVKRFGWEEARQIVNHNKVKLGLAREIIEWGKQEFYNLKTLVDAYDLVQSWGGVKDAKVAVSISSHKEYLKKAIKLVESVDEND